MATGKCELTEEERKTVEFINKNDEENVTKMLSGPGISINKLDEHGMNLINHAAYRGNANMVRQLLDLGADVTAYQHEHGYTTLMFAALSGKCDVTQMILEAGAKTDRTNSVGRTAAQMAAFVGQHQVVSIINNFLQFEDVEYYTKIQGFDKEPRLPSQLARPLYRYVLHSNLSPVQLSLYLQKTPVLLEESEKVCRVLDLMAEKQMKCSHTNEILSMKCHYMSHILRHAKSSLDLKKDDLKFWIRSLLRGRDSDGFCETQEKLIRSTFTDFPWADSQLFQQIIRNLAHVKIGGEPTALGMLTQAINGQRMASEDDNICTTCAEFKAEKRCTNCHMVNYCDQSCQKLHWFTHKKRCKILAEEYKEIQRIEKINAIEDAKRAAAKKIEEEKVAKEEEEEKNMKNSENSTEVQEEIDDKMGDLNIEGEVKENES